MMMGNYRAQVATGFGVSKMVIVAETSQTTKDDGRVG